MTLIIRFSLLCSKWIIFTLCGWFQVISLSVFIKGFWEIYERFSPLFLQPHFHSLPSSFFSFPVSCISLFYPPLSHLHPSPSLSPQWLESHFSLYQVCPTAGCSVGRVVVSTAGRASSLAAGASSPWLWSVWTGTSRSAISDTVRWNLS